MTHELPSPGGEHPGRFRGLTRRILRLSSLARLEEPRPRPLKMILEGGVQDDMSSLRPVLIERMVPETATRLNFYYPPDIERGAILDLVARWEDGGIVTVDQEEVSRGTTADIDHLQELIFLQVSMPVSAVLEDGRIFYRTGLHNREFFDLRLKSFLEFLAQDANPFANPNQRRLK